MTEKRKAEGRPSKKVKEAVEKHEAPKIELKPQPAGPEEKKKIKILDEKSQVYFIYQGMVAGKSIDEIAEELQIVPATVRQHIAEAVDTLNLQIEQIKVNWAQIWIARTEAVVKRMMAKLDEGGSMDYKDFVDTMDKLQKMQERILGTGGSRPQDGTGTNINIIQTIDTGSDLYNQSLAGMQLEYAGKTVPHLEEYVGRDEDTRKLGGLLNDD